MNPNYLCKIIPYNNRMFLPFMGTIIMLPDKHLCECIATEALYLVCSPLPYLGRVADDALSLRRSRDPNCYLMTTTLAIRYPQFKTREYTTLISYHARH